MDRITFLQIEKEMDQAEEKAWKALAGYKFWMFGYHAAQWIMLNRILGSPRPNPFKDAVKLAKEKVEYLKFRNNLTLGDKPRETCEFCDTPTDSPNFAYHVCSGRKSPQ